MKHGWNASLWKCFFLIYDSSIKCFAISTPNASRNHGVSNRAIWRGTLIVSRHNFNLSGRRVMAPIAIFFNSTHREIFSKSNCIYNFPNNLEPNGHCPFAVPNQSENGKYNLISVWFNKIPKIFLCVRIEILFTVVWEEIFRGKVFFNKKFSLMFLTPLREWIKTYIGCSWDFSVSQHNGGPIKDPTLNSSIRYCSDGPRGFRGRWIVPHDAERR